MMQILCAVVAAVLFAASANARLAGECATLCNDLRYDVLTMAMCKEAKRTLPRPKVGDFCTNAMEQGFSDACVALCMDERPVQRVAQTCRAAAIEMPRPTVRRWCEHGYNVAFEKTVKDLQSHFKTEAPPAPIIEQRRAPEPEPVKAEPEVVTAPAVEEVRNTQHRDSSLRGGASAAVRATIPITIGDETKDLVVHEGQNAEEAVVVFCRANVPDDVSSCIRQLLSTVLEKLEESN